MTVVISIILFILLLGLLVVIHELGHFLAAKAFGIKVKEFGLGIPPRAWGLKRGETIYSLNWIPFGGFVSLEGEDDPTSSKKGSFASVSRWKRAIVLVAGVAMNFLLAVVIFSYIFTQGVTLGSVRIAEVVPGSPAAAAGIRPGDTIVAAAGQEIADFIDFQTAIQSNLDHEIELTLLTDNSSRVVRITPRSHPPQGQGSLGVAIVPVTEVKTYLWYQAPIEGTKFAFKLLGSNVRLLGALATQLFAGQTQLAGQVSGPVGIAYLTYKQVQEDPATLLQLAGLVSLSLALMNLLPIPGLDGGRLLFVGLSSLVRRNFYPKLEGYLHTGGFIFLMLLLVLITYNDLAKLVATTSLGGRLHEIFKFIP